MVLTWLFGGFSTNVEEQLAFYGAYHSNPYNQIIHVIFVPMIWFTAAIWLAYTPPLMSFVPYWCNASFVVYLLYAVYYMVLDFETAMFVDLFYLGLLLLANAIVHKEQITDRSKKSGDASAKPSGTRSFFAAKVALVLHIFAWYTQVHWGHVLFEGRKPALLDSFVQSLTLAPLFVFYEVIWFFVPGYKSEMHANVEALVRAAQANIKI